MSEKLKPCIWPQCRSEEVRVSKWWQEAGIFSKWVAKVRCSKCGASGPWCYGEHAEREASEAWNTRPEYKNETPNKLKLVWSTNGQGLHHDFEIASPPTVFDKMLIVHVTEETANEMLNAAREMKEVLG